MRRSAASSLALVLLLAACANEPPVDPASNTSPTADAAPSPPGDELATPESDGPGQPWERPETVTETVIVEGMDEKVTLRLVHFPDAPLPFSTYVYDTWETDVVGSGEGTAVQMMTGAFPAEGVLSLFIPSGSPTEAEIVELARSMAESNGDAQEMVAPANWVRVGYSFRNGGTVGTVQVGEHAGTWFYVYETFPIEMGAGFGPASAVALARLLWDDDGTGL